MTVKYQEREPRDELIRCFKLFDPENTGKINFKSFKKVCMELGEALSDEEIREMINEADRDHDGEIDEEEFCKFMRKTNLYN